MFCSFCHSKNHSTKNCPKTWDGQANRNKMFCIYCWSKTHTVEACPKTWSGSAARKWYPYKVEDYFILD